MKLQLACGNRPIQGWINHDIWKHRPEVDVTHDLEQLPWPWEDGQFNEIIAFDVIEHIHRPVDFINELWRISAPDAIIQVHTAWAGPQSGSREVWRDPTHVRPFHEMSFHYFDPINGGYWFEQYGQFYSQSRFEIVKVQPEPPDNINWILRAIK